MANEKRLIDAKAFHLRVSQRKMTELFPNWKELPEDIKDMLRKHGNYLEMLIETQPTVDAVEVVRCKDCVSFEERYRTPGGTHCGGYCYHWDYETGMSPNQVDGDDFCSYGERKDT